MEIVVKKHIAIIISMNPTPDDFNVKDKLTAKILSNYNVEYYWEDDSKVLLGLIVSLWITIRGFAHTSTWMERNKSATYKKVQKSKGIRKTLIT